MKISASHHTGQPVVVGRFARNFKRFAGRSHRRSRRKPRSIRTVRRGGCHGSPILRPRPGGRRRWRRLRRIRRRLLLRRWRIVCGRGLTSSGSLVCTTPQPPDQHATELSGRFSPLSACRRQALRCRLLRGVIIARRRYRRSRGSRRGRCGTRRLNGRLRPRLLLMFRRRRCLRRPCFTLYRGGRRWRLFLRRFSGLAFWGRRRRGPFPLGRLGGLTARLASARRSTRKLGRLDGQERVHHLAAFRASRAVFAQFRVTARTLRHRGAPLPFKTFVSSINNGPGLSPGDDARSGVCAGSIVLGPPGQDWLSLRLGPLAHSNPSSFDGQTRERLPVRQAFLRAESTILAMDHHLPFVHDRWLSLNQRGHARLSGRASLRISRAVSHERQGALPARPA